MVVRNFWKRILLALFACVWSGCTETEVDIGGGDLYGCPPCGCEACEEPSTDPLPQDSVVVDSVVVGEPAADTVVEQPEEYEVPVAVYGPPCYFDGSCKLGEEEKK